jgi:hypothetical protein
MAEMGEDRWGNVDRAGFGWVNLTSGEATALQDHDRRLLHGAKTAMLTTVQPISLPTHRLRRQRHAGYAEGIGSIASSHRDRAEQAVPSGLLTNRAEGVACYELAHPGTGVQKTEDGCRISLRRQVDQD